MDVISYVLAKNYTKAQIAGLGKGMEYKGSITFANLPTASTSNKGWLYTVTDKNNHEYVCDGTAWVDLGAELDSKQDTLISTGANPNVMAPLYVDDPELRLATGNGLKVATDTQALEVKAGTGITVTASGVNVDTTVMQEKLSAGNGITISGNTISVSYSQASGQSF